MWKAFVVAKFETISWNLPDGKSSNTSAMVAYLPTKISTQDFPTRMFDLAKLWTMGRNRFVKGTYSASS